MNWRAHWGWDWRFGILKNFGGQCGIEAARRALTFGEHDQRRRKQLTLALCHTEMQGKFHFLDASHSALETPEFVQVDHDSLAELRAGHPRQPNAIGRNVDSPAVPLAAVKKHVTSQQADMITPRRASVWCGACKQIMHDPVSDQSDFKNLKMISEKLAYCVDARVRPHGCQRRDQIQVP